MVLEGVGCVDLEECVTAFLEGPLWNMTARGYRLPPSTTSCRRTSSRRTGGAPPRQQGLPHVE
eukprot:9619498-Prorocentrum_lima.AAC.1